MMIPVRYPYLTWSDLAAFLAVGRDCGKTFEERLNEKFRSRYSLTFSSGRAGLYHILKANKIRNKYVLVAAYTCCVVTEAIVQSGNIPVFADLNENSFNSKITEDLIKKYLPDLGAVVVTNLYGFTEFSDLDFISKDRDFLMILDDALAPGHVPRRPAGLYDYAYISCAVRRPFTCLGGGVVFTDDEERFKALRDYTLKNRRALTLTEKYKKFVETFLFFLAFRKGIYSLTSFLQRKTPLLDSFFSEKYNDIHSQNPEYFVDMCDFQKRVGLNQLKKIDMMLQRRREIGDTYYSLLSPHYAWVKDYWKKGVPYSNIPFLHPRRDDLEKHLLNNQIDTERYFDYIIPELEQYRELCRHYNIEGHFPNAENVSKQIILLPVNMGLDEKTISKIVKKIREFDGI